MSVTTQPKARLKHMVTFSRLSLTSWELSVTSQWQSLLCIGVGIVCMCAGVSRTRVLCYRWFDFGADTFRRSWKTAFSLPEKKQWHCNSKCIKRKKSILLERSTETEASFVQLISPLFCAHLCQFYCSSVCVEAPCILVLPLLPSSKVSATSITLERQPLLKRPVRKGTQQFWQTAIKTLISQSGIICSLSLSFYKSCCLSPSVHSCQAHIFNLWFLIWQTVWLKPGRASATFRAPINASSLIISFSPSLWGTEKFSCN